MVLENIFSNVEMENGRGPKFLEVGRLD